MRFLGLIFALIVAVLPPLSSEAQTIPADKNARVELIAEYSGAPENTRLYLALKMDIRDGWHVYWRNPGDAGLPPEIIWTNTPQNVEISEFTWPIPKELPLIEGELMDYGYSKQLVLPFSVKLPEANAGTDTDNWVFDGEADYLICKDVCIPEVQPIALTLAKSEFPQPNLNASLSIQSALESAPISQDGATALSQSADSLMLEAHLSDLSDVVSVRFFPYDNEIVHAAKQIIELGPKGVRLTLKKAQSGVDAANIKGVLVVTNTDSQAKGYEVTAALAPPLDGVTGTSLMVSDIAQTAQTSQTGTSSIAPITILVFAFLGGLLLNIMPCVLPVLAFKAFGMLAAAGEGDGAKLRLHGLLYTAGVLVCFLALAGLTLTIRETYGVASWGQWMQNPAIVALLIFAIVIAGLWMFGAFSFGGSLQNVGQGLTQGGGPKSAFLGGVLAASAGAPCVGPFLGVAIGALFTQPAWYLVLGFVFIALGLASPFLLLSFVPAWTKYLPKPGAWMEHIKQALAFPMFLTAAWLSITMGYLASPETMAYILAGIVGLTAAAWVLGLDADDKKYQVAALIIAAMSIVTPTYLAHTTEVTDAQIQTGSGDLKAIAWSPETVETALASGQGVFVDFTAKWCATCQVNKRTTLKTEEFKNLLDRNNIVFMEADFTRPDQQIAAELQKHNRAGVPLYLYYAPASSQPIILPEVLSIAIVRNAIEK